MKVALNLFVLVRSVDAYASSCVHCCWTCLMIFAQRARHKEAGTNSTEPKRVVHCVCIDFPVLSFRLESTWNRGQQVEDQRTNFLFFCTGHVLRCAYIVSCSFHVFWNPKFLLRWIWKIHWVSRSWTSRRSAACVLANMVSRFETSRLFRTRTSGALVRNCDICFLTANILLEQSLPHGTWVGSRCKASRSRTSRF